MEMQGQEEETLDETTESEPEEGIHCTGVQGGSKLEEEPEYPSDNCSADELIENGWWSPESPQPYSVEDRAGAQHPARERSPSPKGSSFPTTR